MYTGSRKKFEEKAWPGLYLRIFVPLVLSVSAILAAAFFLEGPRLGRWYDFLLRQRPSPAVAREILLIETGGEGGEGAEENIITPGTAAQIILTLTEMEAATLLIQVPVLGVSSGASAGGNELMFRFEEEFGLVKHNITSLFDAIRFGYIGPEETPTYVDKLLALSDSGKERLLSLALRSDEEERLLLEKAARVFGSARIAGDLQLGVILASSQRPFGGSRLRAAQGNTAGVYARIQPDSDGVFRRIAPVIRTSDGDEEYEHIAYAALKERFSAREIERTQEGLFLTLKKAGKAEAASTSAYIPLDQNAAILFEPPHGGEDFRKINIAGILLYNELDQTLYRLLAEAETLPQYSGFADDSYPAYLYEKALDTRADMLDADDSNTVVESWREARRTYLASLDSFFKEETARKIRNNFARIISEEKPDAAGEAKLAVMREELLAAFTSGQEIYQELSTLRTSLSSALPTSFCALGSSEALASALLANSLITTQAITPGTRQEVLLWSIAGALLCLFVFFFTPPPLTLFGGLFLSACAAFGFSYSFIVTGLWIDPLVPTLGCLCASLSAAATGFALRTRAAVRLRQSLAPFVGEASLRRLAALRFSPERALAPGSEFASSFTVAVVVRDAAVTTKENSSEPAEAAERMRRFHAEVTKEITAAGAVIIARAAGMVVAAFGSPIERLVRTSLASRFSRKAPAPLDEESLLQRAADLARTAREAGENKWYCGIDCGECVYIYTRESGFTAAGQAALHARTIATLALRYKRGILVSAALAKRLPPDSLKTVESPSGDPRAAALLFELT